MRRRFVQASTTCYFRDGLLTIPGYAFNTAKQWDDTGSTTLLAEGKSLQDDSPVLAKIAPAHSNGSMCLEREAHIIDKLQSTPEAMSTILRLIDFFHVPEENGDCFVLLVVHPGLNLLGRYFPSSSINEILLADHSDAEQPPSSSAVIEEDARMAGGDEPEAMRETESPVFDVMDLTSFLEFAILTTTCLEVLHNAGTVHREVRSNAFHHNAHTGSVRFAHFGNRSVSLEEMGGPSALLIRAEALPTFERAKVEDAVCYLAPEQTGSADTTTEDGRTDIYALGILFWRLLVGQGKLPFEGGPMEILHDVAQKTPMPVDEVRRDLPHVLGKIIDKMVAKNPDQRYNSAFGLKADLMKCQKRLLLAVTELAGQSSELIPYFEVGQHDLFREFTIPLTLFGRDKELETIRLVIRHATATFTNQLVGRTLTSSSNGTNLTPIDESVLSSSESSGSRGAVPMGQAPSTDGVQSDINPRLFRPSTLSAASEVVSEAAAAPPTLVTRSSSASGSSTGSDSSIRRLPITGSGHARRSRIVVVAGPAGVGKSSLILANRTKWRAARGLWGQAKFTAKEPSPFSALLRCLSSVLRQLMLFPPDLHRLVNLLRSRLGPQLRNLPLLYHSVPEIREILSLLGIEMTPSEELPEAHELRLRFRSLVANIYIVLADVRMLAVFLDDLHEIDDQSLDMISHLASSQRQLLILASLRNEDPTRVAQIRTVFSQNLRTTWIELEPLSYASVLSLTCKTLHQSEETAAPLARLIRRLTAGNAFALRSLLTNLYRQSLIAFNAENNCWDFDLATIEANLVDQAILTDLGDYTYLLSHLHQLPTDARKYITWASFLGSSFKMNEVQLLMDWEYNHSNGTKGTNGTTGSDEESDESSGLEWALITSDGQLPPAQSRGATNGLQLAVAEGWIVQHGRGFAAFAHDQYLRAAQIEAAELPEETIEKMAFRILTMLLREEPPDPFRVAEFSKRCVSLIRADPKCSEILDLVVTAADAAWARGSHELAFVALHSASAILGDAWDQDPERAYYLRFRLAELFTWKGDYGSSDEMIQACLDRPMSPEQKARLLRLRSRNFWLRKDFSAALQDTILALHALGVEIAPSPSFEASDEMFEVVKDEILALGLDQILAIPRTADPRIELATTLLNEASTHAFWSPGEGFADVIGLTTIKLGLRHGMSAGTALGFLQTVTAAAERRGLYRFSIDLGRVALRLADQYGGSLEKCRAQIMYCLNVSGFENVHIRANIPRCAIAVKYGDSSGDRISSCLALVTGMQARLYTCEHLESLAGAAQEMLDTIESAIPTADTVVLATGVVNCIRALGGYTLASSAETAFDTETFTESEYGDKVRQSSGNVLLVLNFYDAFKLVALFCLGFVEQAAMLGFLVYESRHTHPNHRHTRFAMCYHSLALIACLRDHNVGPADAARYRSQVDLNQAYLRKWLPASPVNTSSWVFLVDAELAALNGDPEALKLYDSAVKSAINHEWLLEEGWALYLQGSHFIRIGVDFLGAEMQRKGITRQAHWGARGIVDYLQTQSGPLKQPIHRSMFSIDVAVQTESVMVDNAPLYRPQDERVDAQPITQDDNARTSLSAQDLMSVLKWSKEISLDVNLSSGLQRLTEIASETSGAQLTSIALTGEAGDYSLVTSLSPPDLCLVYDNARPVRSLPDKLQSSVLLHSLNSRKRLCIDDATQDARFASEADQSPHRSVTCIPIFIIRGSTVGALYMASQYPLPRGVVAVLTLLCQQASISLANALLFRSIQSGTRENLKMIASQRAALEEARRSREEALKAAKTKSNFLASMSHELRTPFSSFYGLLDLLTGTELNPGQQEIVQTAKQSCELLLKIIDSILDYSKLEASALKLEFSAFAVEDLIADCMELLLPMAAKKLDMTFNIDPGVPAWILADYTRIRQVLMNLVGNACKFTSTGSVSVTCALDTSPPREASEILLKISIQDTGIGLSPADVESLFVPFHQADNSTTRRFGGTGLGLSISRELITLMDGQIGVESELGVGSTFWFRIPVQISDSKEATEALAEIEHLREQLKHPEPVQTLLCSPASSTRSLLAAMLEGFPVSFISTVDELSDVMAVEDSQLAHLDFIIIDHQSEDRIDNMARTWHEANPSTNAKIIHLFTPTSETLSRNAHWGHPMPGLARMTKPPRQGRLLRTMLAMSDRPFDQETAPRETEVSKAIQTLASVKRRLYGNVLIAEDNPVARSLLIKQLERQDLNVIATTNGLEAIEEWEKHPMNFFTVALFDHHMPVCDGVEATKRLRVLETNLKLSFRLPVVALSADCQESTKQLCLSAGMNAFFSKPLKKSDLVSLLSMFEPPPAQ